ncbi:MAG: hypothetical protein AB7S26_04955 [Sandaracinaceae bacterium]
MLMVLMVLMMTTATATFAIHATTMEMRAAGHSRTAMQTSYVAEAGLNAGLAYMDVNDRQAVLIQIMRTQVGANVQSAANSATVGRETNLLRIEMDDFTLATNVNSPPIETDPLRTPSLGPRSASVASFTVDGTDPFRSTRARAGTASDGRFQYLNIALTSRARVAPPGDTAVGTDPRTFNESAVNARAYAVMGPVPAS